MEVTLGGKQSSHPAGLLIAGMILFSLGCIWPAVVWDDFQLERDAAAWEITNATVINLKLGSYEYDCSSEDTTSTCTQYTISYQLRFEVNNTIYNIRDSDEISYFESQVWKIDHPVNSTMDIAYNSDNPNEIDVDPGNYLPFLPPLLVFMSTSVLAALFVLGAIKGAFSSSNGVKELTQEEKEKLPQSSDEITFAYTKTVWGVREYQHPTVEALEKKLESYSCTEKQIDAFFNACKEKEEQASSFEERIDLEWLNGVNEMVEQHSSINKFNLPQKVRMARVFLIMVSVVFGVVTLLFALPLWLTYSALPWYAWIPIWGTISPIGLILLSFKIISEFEKFADQGLFDLLIQFVEDDDY